MAIVQLAAIGARELESYPNQEDLIKNLPHMVLLIEALARYQSVWLLRRYYDGKLGTLFPRAREEIASRTEDKG